MIGNGSPVSGNFTVCTGVLTGYFVINIDWELYSSTSFTLSITAYSDPGFVGHVTGGSGSLAIQARDTLGGPTQQGFNFVTYKN